MAVCLIRAAGSLVRYRSGAAVHDRVGFGLADSPRFNARLAVAAHMFFHWKSADGIRLRTVDRLHGRDSLTRRAILLGDAVLSLSNGWLTSGPSSN